MKKVDTPLVGILGGLGPLVSARFLDVIYRVQGVYGKEQELPSIVLYSDPSIPDRTDCLLAGKEEVLLSILIERIESLLAIGATRIIVSCITFHYLLPKLPPTLAEKVISLTSVSLAEVIRRKERSLLLCTEGSRQMGIFDQDPKWIKAQPWVIKLDKEDQKLVHQFIYDIKRNQFPSRMEHSLKEMQNKYDVTSFIAGCTEFHLTATQHLVAPIKKTEISFIDPLLITAQNWKNLEYLDIKRSK